jgi:DNA-binding winged helix-turn-helix (wHTH) protein
MDSCEVYAFGAFALDVHERRLTTDGTAVPLPPKALDLLVTLVRAQGRLVSKKQLLDEVWPEAFVEEGVLAVHISGIRKALGDDSRLPRFIETVSRSGYRFIAPVLRRSGRHDRGPQHAQSDRRIPSAEVYELVGRGRFHLLSASIKEVPKAVEAFRISIQREPTYAPAHAGLALACCAQAELRLAAPADAYREARAAALRALAMDDSNADAQVALAAVLFLSDWNWVGAERSLKRALELNPSHTEAYLLYGRLLEALGRLEEGLEMKLKALERDPLLPAVHLQVSLSYWNQRRYGDAIEWANKTLELDPDHLLAREHLAAAYWKMGDFERQMAESARHAEAYGVSPEVLAPVKEAYARGGRAGVVRYVLDRAAAGSQAVPAMQLALFHGEVGEMDQAFEHLERAIEDRDPSLVHLAVAPQWDCLRRDPRFADCLARMDLVSD